MYVLNDTVTRNITTMFLEKGIWLWIRDTSICRMNEWMNIERSFSLRCLETPFSAFQYHDILKMWLAESIPCNVALFFYPQWGGTIFYIRYKKCTLHKIFLNFKGQLT
jgi:hypothetical protein